MLWRNKGSKKKVIDSSFAQFYDNTSDLWI